MIRFYVYDRWARDGRPATWEVWDRGSHGFASRKLVKVFKSEVAAERHRDRCKTPTGSATAHRCGGPPDGDGHRLLQKVQSAVLLSPSKKAEIVLRYVSVVGACRQLQGLEPEVLSDEDQAASRCSPSGTESGNLMADYGIEVYREDTDALTGKLLALVQAETNHMPVLDRRIIVAAALANVACVLVNWRV